MAWAFGMRIRMMTAPPTENAAFMYDCLCDFRCLSTAGGYQTARLRQAAGI